MAVFDLHVAAIDAYTREFRKSYQFEAADFAAAEPIASSFLTALGNLIGGDILRYTLSAETTYTDVVTALANKDEAILLTFMKEDNKKATIRVPTPIKADYVNADGSVDLTDAAIVAFAAFFIAGPFYLSDGETATELLKGKLED